MPSRYDVTAVCKTEGRNAFETVTHLCGKSYDGSMWKIPLADAVEGVRCGRFEFLVTGQDGKTLALRIARSPYGNYYLKTDKDRGEPRLLLNLPGPYG
ncbi:hypothetical protein [Kordiimonas sp.]|uniref:hypothetical protein n=1 Tax=Kordiimonas sp. TaxID=1970157 RepID=UPI003A8CB2DF